jgi:hypothetical protein
MNGYNNLVLPFGLNFREIAENKEVVLNGLSAIQRFFHGNIWLPLGADVEILFVRGVVGVTEDLCDWFEVAANWPDFEPEVPEEIDLWYIISVCLFFFLIIYLIFVYFKASGRVS